MINVCRPLDIFMILWCWVAVSLILYILLFSIGLYFGHGINDYFGVISYLQVNVKTKDFVHLNDKKFV